MTQKHDYKAALDALHEIGVTGCLFELRHHNYTIRHALAMMQKLQEPSEGMLRDLTRGFRDYYSEACPYPAARTATKAMLEQAEKEIAQ